MDTRIKDDEVIEECSHDRQKRFLDIELEKRKWKNRRKMAWISLVAMIIVTLILLFAPIPESRLKILSEPIIWFYFSMTSVIGIYMGATTWASIKRK
ncbi:MAG: hypothetical protein ACTSWK_00280 [Promethearchaeota archaeon]